MDYIYIPVYLLLRRRDELQRFIFYKRLVCILCILILCDAY